MGTSRWDDDTWSTYTAPISHKTDREVVKEVFTSTKLNGDLDPLKIKMRESCDSTVNPKSTPIIIAVDETGSMGQLAGLIIKKGLGVVIKEIYERSPVPDPHVMLMAFGDAYYDNSPLQVTQFEADISLAKQCEKFHIEQRGGGNLGESYNLPWYFAANKTKCDSFLKRNKKGYLFTVGDEPPLPTLTKEHIKKFIGDDVQDDIQTRDLLTQVSKQWEVFHVIIDHPCVKGSKEEWNKLLGQRALVLEDHDKLAELIVSTIQVNEGADTAAVIDSWDGTTQLVLRNSLTQLSAAESTSSVTRF